MTTTTRATRSGGRAGKRAKRSAEKAFEKAKSGFKFDVGPSFFKKAEQPTTVMQARKD